MRVIMKIALIIVISNLVIINSYSTILYCEKGENARGIVHVTWNNNSKKNLMFEFRLIGNTEETHQITLPAHGTINTAVQSKLTHKYVGGNRKNEYRIVFIFDKAKTDTQKKYHDFNGFAFELVKSKMGKRETDIVNSYNININIDEKFIIQVTDHNGQVLLSRFQLRGILNGLPDQDDMLSYINKSKFDAAAMKEIVVFSGQAYAIPDTKIVKKGRKIIKSIREGQEESNCITLLRNLIKKYAPNPNLDIQLYKIMYEAACNGYSEVFRLVGDRTANWCVTNNGYTAAQAVSNYAPKNSRKILTMIKNNNLDCLARPDARNISPAMYAARSLNVEAIDFFRELSKEKNIDYFGTPVFDKKGAPWNAYKILRNLSKRHIDNRKHKEYYEFSKDALRNAVEYGVSMKDFTIIYSLHKQKKNKRNVKRALRLAAFMGRNDVIKFLAQENPGSEFINAIGRRKGSPALAFAIQNGQLTTIELLIKLRANLIILNDNQILKLFDNIDRKLIPKIIQLTYSSDVINLELANVILHRHGFSLALGNDSQGLQYDEIVQTANNISASSGIPVRLMNLD